MGLTLDGRGMNAMLLDMDLACSRLLLGILLLMLLICLSTELQCMLLLRCMLWLMVLMLPTTRARTPIKLLAHVVTSTAAMMIERATRFMCDWYLFHYHQSPRPE